MATTEHFKNGGGTSFSFVFPILANSDLKVEIYNDTTKVWDLKTENTSGQTDNDYTISNTNVVFNSATPSGTGNVHIYRNTNVDNPAAVYAAGSSIRAVDLNDNQTQVLYSTQEAANQKIRETDLKDSIVTSAKIVDNSIVDIDINTNAQIAGTKITPNFGSQAVSTSGTAATGQLTVTGNIQVSGQVDGRDVAADGTKLDTVETNAKDDQTAAEIKTLLQSDKITDSEIATGTLDNRYYTETELDGGALDGRYYTETEAEARFLRQDSTETIASGDTWSGLDSKVATTAAIDARIVDLVDDVGGFVAIANETSFPNANPDVNNGPGTIVSVAATSALINPTGAHIATIANGTVGNSTVTITGLTFNIPVGFGFLVETTGTLHTYSFHRLVPKATEVTTVAGSITNINNVGGSISNVNTVAGSIGNVNSVAGNASNINSAVSNASNINSAVSNASNINTVAGISGNVTTVAGISSNVTTVANDGTDIGTVATNIGNVNTVAGISSNVTTVANNNSNITSVAGNSTNITAVASNASNINSAVANASNINSAVSNASNINNVASNNTNIGTVAGISGNVTTVAGISGDVTTVANDGTDIGTVAGSISNVNTTAGSIANVNTTAGSISNVNTVATNITNVNNASTYLNNFLALYLGEHASDPSVDALGNSIDEGDLYWNNVTKQLRLYNGSTWQGIADNALELLRLPTSGFSAVYTASAGNNNINLGGLAITGAAFSNESFAPTRMSLAKGSATYNLGGI